MTYWWMSFVKEGRFAGGCIVEAPDEIGALTESWRLGLNPGGEVLMHEVPPEFERNVPKVGVNKLLTKFEIDTIDAQIAEHDKGN